MDVSDRSSLPRHASQPARVALPRSADGLPPVDRAFWRIVDDGLSSLSLELSGGARAAIDAQARLLLAWNAHVNLSGLRTLDQIARGHVLDSLVAVAPLRALGRARPSMLDLGSGAGYPGLPLAVALPTRRAALVDSVAKKAAFLEVAVGAGLDGPARGVGPGHRPSGRIGRRGGRAGPAARPPRRARGDLEARRHGRGIGRRDRRRGACHRCSRRRFGANRLPPGGGANRVGRPLPGGHRQAPADARSLPPISGRAKAARATLTRGCASVCCLTSTATCQRSKPC